ncbi:hypothetical protein OOZ19_00250 [Saccharopolyspora sp. NFXS83]|uniref:hypothetical protein n=1 Tax=Saccharopolyspora sp. NFXS83 TaxID=2993560 RepID=UPI00224ABB85|nr:hypothetical protein [Saccharopolyspora sp. NFXS83]MCX2728660.1 hypothetical protein [Saccharopolyspora sp. NFXS83]
MSELRTATTGEIAVPSARGASEAPTLPERPFGLPPRSPDQHRVFTLLPQGTGRHPMIRRRGSEDHTMLV